MYNVFEMFLHAYKYEYKVPNSEKITIFELDSKPYWFDEKLIFK